VIIVSPLFFMHSLLSNITKRKKLQYEKAPSLLAGDFAQILVICTHIPFGINQAERDMFIRSRWSIRFSESFQGYRRPEKQERFCPIKVHTRTAYWNPV
jgi:hypothetical protein